MSTAPTTKAVIVKREMRSFLAGKRRLKPRSYEIVEAPTKSWLSAVDMMADRIAASRMPATTGGIPHLRMSKSRIL